MIVVGVDGSEESKVALGWALEEAELRNASLRVVHAAHDYAHERDRFVWLDGIVRDVAGQSPGPEVAQSIVDGGAASVLVEEARNADMVVVGSRGRGGFAGLLLGSVSHQCAHHASCPVAIVRRGVPGHRPGIRSEEASDEQEMGRVVVGIDCSWAAKAVLRFAVDEARLRRSSLHVIHAWRYSTGGLYTYGAPRASEPAEGSLRRRTHKEQERLENLVRKLAPAADVEMTQSAVEGAPARVLLEAAQDAELLVVGSRGQGGFAGLLLGSVSLQCAHHASCPVVIVRPPDTPHPLMWPEI